MLIPSLPCLMQSAVPSLSRRVNANSQRAMSIDVFRFKLIKKGEC